MDGRHVMMVIEAFQARLGVPQMRKHRLGNVNMPGSIKPAPGPSMSANAQSGKRFPNLFQIGTPMSGKLYKPRKPSSITHSPSSIKTGGY